MIAKSKGLSARRQTAEERGRYRGVSEWSLVETKNRDSQITHNLLCSVRQIYSTLHFVAAAGPVWPLLSCCIVQSLLKWRGVARARA